jgi:hypothetical protein
MQEFVLAASQVRRRRDAGEILDMPETRVGYLLASTGAALREAAERRTERERPVASPGAARLREYLNAIVHHAGRPVRPAQTAIAWRRDSSFVRRRRRCHRRSSAD